MNLRKLKESNGGLWALAAEQHGVVTRAQLLESGFRPDLGLVVETDGLRYHRTAGQQARDRLRDQVQAAAGLTPLRFTHAHLFR